MALFHLIVALWDSQKNMTCENTAYHYRSELNKTTHDCLKPEQSSSPTCLPPTSIRKSKTSQIKEEKKMATAKKSEVMESGIALEQIKPKTMIVTVNGTSDLILCKKSRSYEREEVYKQSHPKGTKIPAEYQQPYSLFEKLITSIHWLNPIEFHDDDYSKYTEEEWQKYMIENKPCILANSWTGSFNEAFISCGFKDSTGKAGTDLKRTISFETLTPISFAKAGFDQHLAQTSGLSRTNVLTQQNVFSGWTADVEIHYLPIAFPKETVLGIMQCAGTFIGVGARRKEGYGRFELAEVREID